MAAKTYISFQTAGGRSVDLRYEPMPQNLGDPQEGMYADCTGCSEPRGPGSEHATREWAHKHAMKCTSRPT